MIRNLAYRGLAAFAQTFTESKPDYLRVLMYHRVDEATHKPHLALCTLSATPDDFEQQVRYLSKNHTVVSMSDVSSAILGGDKLPPRAVLITFDDAYDCFQRNAWPILKQHNLPAVLFVPTLFPSNRHEHFWWDTIHQLVFASNKQSLTTEFGSLPIGTKTQQESALERLTDLYVGSPAAQAQNMIETLRAENEIAPQENDTMTWEEIRELVDQGLELGDHTCSHPLLSRAEFVDAEREITESVAEIQKHTGCEVDTLAYPGGAYNAQTMKICRDAGIQIAFTTCRGANDLRTADPLELRRINVGRNATVPKIQAQLLLRQRWINSLFKSSNIP